MAHQPWQRHPVTYTMPCPDCGADLQVTSTPVLVWAYTAPVPQLCMPCACSPCPHCVDLEGVSAA